MPTMRALQAHGWNEGTVQAGDEYLATEREAELLLALGWAAKVDAFAPVPRQRRQYRRRDMTATN